MTGYNKVFLDTAPLIYFLDDDVNFGQKAKSVFEEILSNGKPESVKFKLPSKAERLINTAFSPKVLMFEFAPNGCRKTYIIKCLKHLISCEVQALFINRVSRIQGKTIVSSSITCHEYLVYPYRTGNQEKIDVFFEFTEACGIKLIAISAKIAETAAKIRAEYHDFKAMDSLQLAVAAETGCDAFLTNDKQLKQYKGMNCITL